MDLSFTVSPSLTCLTKLGWALGLRGRLRWRGPRPSHRTARETRGAFGDAAFGVFRQLLRGGSVLHSVHRLARVVLEVAEESFQLVFHLANFGLLFFAAFRS